MKKEVKPVENKELIKEFTVEEARRIIKEDLMVDNDPKALLKEFRKEVLPAYFTDIKEKKMSQEEFSEKANQVMIALGPDTHLPLVFAVSPKYQSLVLELTHRIEKEYNCQTVSEIMLAEVVALSHTRALELSTRLSEVKSLEYLSHEKNGYYGLLGKEIDRSHRRMMYSLSLLKQMKQPSVEINIKSKNTFLAQNQQFNTESPLETIKNEINDTE